MFLCIRCIVIVMFVCIRYVLHCCYLANNNNSRDSTIPQGVQEEKGIEFVYEVYERR